MLLTKEVEVVINATNIDHLKKVGYKIPMTISKKGKPCYEMNVPILVKVEDLSDGSHSKVEVECDKCGVIANVLWASYIRGFKNHGNYYCSVCIKAIRTENSLISRRSKAESIAQFLIEEHGENALETYLDCEKNKQLGINPWELSCGSNFKIWAKCIHTNYHESYITTPSSIKRKRDCPYCAGRKVHALDSLGKLLEDHRLLNMWSDKNKKSPYEYAIHCRDKAWFKCLDGIHRDYFRSIRNSVLYAFRCPECQYSKGETKINDYLIKNNIEYDPQKLYDGLVGVNEGNLSYDFYLPGYNILIEYQGEYHDNTVPNQAKEQFEKQQEHDKRKREYAKSHDVELLEIWYWDFDNIEEILDERLNNNL